MSVYACSDFHGFKSLYEQINKFIKPEDKVIFLGDAADRGPFGWEIIKLILDNPQWTYLMGNHDYMFVKSILGPEKYEQTNLHIYNGGKATLNEFLNDTEENRKYYINALNNVEYDYHYINKNNKHIYLSHSGAIYANSINKEEFVWDRSHFFEKNLSNEDIDIIIHGHTTIPHLVDKLKKFNKIFNMPQDSLLSDVQSGSALWYADGRKCDIDNCTIASGACVLIDLDTFKEYSFFIDDREEKYLW